MLSRVAETIYWMHRYRERAENTGRLLEVNLHLSIDSPIEVGNQWEPMVQTTNGQELFNAKYTKSTRDNVIRFLTFDLENPNSILSCLKKARENARSIRETIATEIWDEINTAYLFCQKASETKKNADTSYSLFNRIKRQCQLITAVADTCMSHDEAWHFGRMGNLIERADMTTRMLDVKYFMLLESPTDIGSPFDNIQWVALLKSASAMQMYRKEWHLVKPHRIVDFLILHKTFPRAVFSCLDRLEQSLAIVSASETEKTDRHPHALSQAFLKALAQLNGESIVAQGLHEFIEKLQEQLDDIDRAIFQHYFFI